MIQVVGVVVPLNHHVVNEGIVRVAHGYPADDVLVLLEKRQELFVHLGVFLGKLVLLGLIDGDRRGAVVNIAYLLVELSVLGVAAVERDYRHQRNDQHDRRRQENYLPDYLDGLVAFPGNKVFGDPQKYAFLLNKICHFALSFREYHKLSSFLLSHSHMPFQEDAPYIR